MTQDQIQFKAMQAAVTAALPECCQEILEWQNTGELNPKGKVKEAAKYLTNLTESQNSPKLRTM